MSPRTPCGVTRVRPKRLRYRQHSQHTGQTLTFRCGAEKVAVFCPLQEAEAFALYHKALDLQKHDKFEESARAYHELLKTPLLKEVKILDIQEAHSGVG